MTNIIINTILIALIPAYWFLLNLIKKKYSKLFPTFFGVKLVKNKHDLLFDILNMTLFIILILIIINPKIPLHPLDKTNNIVFVIDTSGSMSAKDLKPDRLDAAISYTSQFIKKAKANDRIGIIGFSTYPYIVSFLTQDHDQAIYRLKNIRQPGGNTNMGDSLAMGIDMATSIPAEHSFLILMSDGVSNAGSPISKALEYAKKKGVTIFTIAIGEQEKTLLGYDIFGNPEYAGVDVKTLTEIAHETGGQFYRAKDNVDLKEIYASLKKQILDKKEPRSIRKQLIELFFALFIIYIILKAIYKIPY